MKTLIIELLFQTVDYQYDSERLLVSIEDIVNNYRFQYFYGDLNNPKLITHSCRNSSVITEYFYDNKHRFKLNTYFILIYHL